MIKLFVVFSITVIAVVKGGDEVTDRSINQLLDEYEREVQRLPVYKTPDTTPKPLTNGLDEVMSQYESEANRTGTNKTENTGVRQLDPLSGSNGLGGLGPGLLKPIRDILYNFVLILADFIRKLAASIKQQLIDTACQIGRSMEKLFGADHFVVRFLREFFDRETSPFVTSIQISERLDKIMDIYWSGINK